MRVHIQLCAAVLLLSAGGAGAVPRVVLPRADEFREPVRVVRDAADRVRLAEAEFEIFRNRAAWARRMVARGYVTEAQAAAAEKRAAKTELVLRDARRALKALATGLTGHDRDEMVTDAAAWVKLAEADLEQARERAAWARRMVVKGLLTPTQAKVDEMVAVSAELALRDARRAFESLSREARPKK